MEYFSNSKQIPLLPNGQPFLQFFYTQFEFDPFFNFPLRANFPLTHLMVGATQSPFLGHSAHFCAHPSIQSAPISQNPTHQSWKPWLDHHPIIMTNLLFLLIPIALANLANAGMVNVCSDVKVCGDCTNSYVNIFAFREYCRWKHMKYIVQIDLYIFSIQFYKLELK